MLKEYIGQGELTEHDLVNYCGAHYGEFDDPNKIVLARGMVNAPSREGIPIICVNSHEGPKEVSDLVLGEGEGKATEERKLFETAFSTIAENKYQGKNPSLKVLWLYGNDGKPKAVTNDMTYVGCPVRVHHLAELDEKKNPESMKGDITYVDHKTAEILSKDRKSGELVPHQVK
jgi:hypothetical protein